MTYIVKSLPNKDVNDALSTSITIARMLVRHSVEKSRTYRAISSFGTFQNKIMRGILHINSERKTMTNAGKVEHFDSLRPWLPNHLHLTAQHFASERMPSTFRR